MENPALDGNVLSGDYPRLVVKQYGA